MHQIYYFTVVSTERYQGPPSSDLKFPDKDDLVNYTKNKDISEIIIPPSLVRERLKEIDKNGECTTANIKDILVSIDTNLTLKNIILHNRQPPYLLYSLP